ncbi:MAG: FecR domain-containing protein [Deltaproteobacteria bacterium]|nr:FecR domain-containing protein [Deltaproteobacteria bacterium]
MKPCHNLKDYLLGMLDDAGREVFEAHLGGCSVCRDEVSAWEGVDDAVNSWSDSRAVPETSPFVANRLVKVASQGRQPKLRRQTLSPLSIAAASALAAAAAIVLVVHFTGNDDSGDDALTMLVEPTLVHAEGGEIRLDQEAGEAALTVENEGRLLATVEDDRIAVSSRSDARLSRNDRGALRIRLVRGAVTVAAAKRDGTAPLMVVAGSHRVEVVGTRFKVSLAEDGGFQVAVSEGKVRVVGDDGSSRFVLEGQLFELATRGEERIAALEAGLARSMDALLEERGAPELEPIEGPAAEVALVEPIDEEIDSGPPDVPAIKPRPVVDATDLGEIKNWILAGKLDQAETALELHLRRHRRDVKAWNLLANCRRKAGNFGDAVAGYRKVIEYGSAGQSNRARFIAATVLQDRMARQGEAAALLEAYLERPQSLKPLEAEAMVRLARAQLRTKRTGEAHALLRKVIDRFPGTTAALQARRLLPIE